VKEPTAGELKENVLKPMLAQAANFDDCCQLLLKGYYTIKRLQRSAEVSIRDLKSLTARFKWLATNNQNTDIKSLVFQACVHEFYHGIREPGLRDTLINALQTSLEVKSQPTVAENIIDYQGFIATPGFQTIINIIEENLLLSEQSQTSHIDYKQGIILEGPSGIGKSTITRKNSREKRLSKCSRQSKCGEEILPINSRHRGCGRHAVASLSSGCESHIR